MGNYFQSCVALFSGGNAKVRLVQYRQQSSVQVQCTAASTNKLFLELLEVTSFKRSLSIATEKGESCSAYVRLSPVVAN